MTGILVKLIAERDGVTGLGDCYRIRQDVFCVEQRISAEIEWDGLDQDCDHLLALLEGRPVGTARVRVYSPGVGKIERVAVLASARRRGVGAALTKSAIDRLRTLGMKRAILNAQTAVQNFYLALGFRPEGGEFDEAGIPHIRMALDLAP